MSKTTIVLLILTAATICCVTSVYAQSTGTAIKVEAPKIEKPSQSIEKTPTDTQPAESYDSFKDDNKNGIDDRFEKAEKQRVKVQGIKDKSKPTRQEKKEEPKTKPPGS
jgi:stringent starvation protein B